MRMVWHCYGGKGVADGRSRLRLMISLRNTALLSSSQTHTGAFQGRHILRGTFSSSCVAMNVSNTRHRPTTVRWLLKDTRQADAGVDRAKQARRVTSGKLADATIDEEVLMSSGTA